MLCHTLSRLHFAPVSLDPWCWSVRRIALIRAHSYAAIFARRGDGSEPAVATEN